MKPSAPTPPGASASQLITRRIAELGGWRGETLGRIRALIKEADPDILEEWKWMGTPVWSHDGIVCTGEAYKAVVKMTFAKGASLKDPSRLFNSSLDGNVRRAIDVAEGEKIDERALKALFREAVALNVAKKKPAKKAASASKAAVEDKTATKKTATKKTATKKTATKKTATEKTSTEKTSTEKRGAR